MPSYSGVWTLSAVVQAIGAGTWPSYVAPIGLFLGGNTATNEIGRAHV